jgi:hypothetical protein
MWTSCTDQLPSGRLIKVAIDLDSAPVSYKEVLLRWQNDPVFHSFFLSLLADVPFPAYRWETPAVTSASISRPFEFVVLDSPELATTPSFGVR